MHWYNRQLSKFTTVHNFISISLWIWLFYSINFNCSICFTDICLCPDGWQSRLLYGMMTSSNGTISALLVLCAGNSPVTGEFPSQMLVTRSFGVFFDLRLNKRLSNNQDTGDLRRHYDVNVMKRKCILHYKPFVRRNHRSPVESQRPNKIHRFKVSYLLSWTNCWTNTVQLALIWDALTVVWHCSNMHDAKLVVKSSGDIT